MWKRKWKRLFLIHFHIIQTSLTCCVKPLTWGGISNPVLTVNSSTINPCWATSSWAMIYDPIRSTSIVNYANETVIAVGRSKASFPLQTNSIDYLLFYMTVQYVQRWSALYFRSISIYLPTLMTKKLKLFDSKSFVHTYMKIKLIIKTSESIAQLDGDQHYMRKWFLIRHQSPSSRHTPNDWDAARYRCRSFLHLWISFFFSLINRLLFKENLKRILCHFRNTTVTAIDERGNICTLFIFSLLAERATAIAVFFADWKRSRWIEMLTFNLLESCGKMRNKIPLSWF